MINSTTTDLIVASFANVVRDHLRDLGAVEVRELTEGLEADLSERFADSGTLGDPAAYAQELRESAGLPERSGHDFSPKRGIQRLRTRGESLLHRIRESRRGAAVLDFLVTLRPLWWVLRGWVAFFILVIFGLNIQFGLPTDLLGWVLLLATIVVSVQWGRGRWMPWPALRWGKIAVSVVTALIALPLVVATISQAHSAAQSYAYAYTEPPVDPTLRFGNTAVPNIFAYDCAGNPLPRVQLFDGTGAPIQLHETQDFYSFDDSTGKYHELVPGLTTDFGVIYNAFPWSEIPQPDPESSNVTLEPTPSPTAAAVLPEPPFAQAPTLPGCAVAPELETETEAIPEEQPAP